MRLQKALARVVVFSWALFPALCWPGPVVRAQPDPTLRSDPRWCAPEFDVVGEDVCYFAPLAGNGHTQNRSPDTLVIFLHGVIHPGTEWQWAQQRAIARAAREVGFEALMPRGRRGIGPRTMKDWWTWPTSTRAQGETEEQLLAQWTGARASVEAQRGRPFRTVLVMGFSNGAYYAASLALRGKLKVDGYAMFAGGGAQYLERAARKTTLRPPIYVGYGGRDRVGVRDARAFGALLDRLGWRHKLVGRPSVGHSMTDAQLREAVEFMAGRRRR